MLQKLYLENRFHSSNRPYAMKIPYGRKCLSLRVLLRLSLLLVSLLIPSIAVSGVFGVTPIRLDFDKNTKSGVVTVKNEGEEELTVQMKAMEWTQDGEGKDAYSETRDIIFYPTIMRVEKNEERIIRAGIRVPASGREKTYRLFIEEIPRTRDGGGVRIAMAIRFGVPIFVRPLRAEPKGEMGKIQLSKGVFSVRISNTGNVHFRINSVQIKGTNTEEEETFSKELDGWYLLNAVSRTYTAPIPESSCRETARLNVFVETDQFDLNGRLDVDQAMCLP